MKRIKTTDSEAWTDSQAQKTKQKKGLKHSFKDPNKKYLWWYSSLIFRRRKDIEFSLKKIPNAHWTKTYDVIDHMTVCRHRKFEGHYK